MARSPDKDIISIVLYRDLKAMLKEVVEHRGDTINNYFITNFGEAITSRIVSDHEEIMRAPRPTHPARGALGVPPNLRSILTLGPESRA
jgi:hypothetical protein